MKPSPAKVILTFLISLAAQGGHALANPIYFDFESQVKTPAGNGYFTPASSTSTASAWLSGEYAGHFGTVAAPASITIADLGWQVSPSNEWFPGTPSNFNPQPFKLALTLTDEASHAQGTFHYQGSFSLLDRSDPSGILSITPSIQSLAIGHNIYTVDLGHQTTWVTQNDWELMAAYGGGYSVSAQVTAQPLPVQSAPEPASLTLAGLALATILGGGLHRSWVGRKPRHT